MRWLKRLLTPKDVLSLLDSIASARDYSFGQAQRAGKEDIAKEALRQNLIEKHEVYSGISIGDWDATHTSLRLTKKGRPVAIARSERKNFRFHEHVTQIIISVIGGLIVLLLGAYIFGIGK